MSTGKAVAQGAHASEQAIRNNPSAQVYLGQWDIDGHTKVVLAAKDLAQLMKVMSKAEDLGLPCSIIVDQGRTELEAYTVTCGAIGPASSEKIDAITKRLRLY